MFRFLLLSVLFLVLTKRITSTPTRSNNPTLWGKNGQPESLKRQNELLNNRDQSTSSIELNSADKGVLEKTNYKQLNKFNKKEEPKTNLDPLQKERGMIKNSINKRNYPKSIKERITDDEDENTNSDQYDPHLFNTSRSEQNKNLGNLKQALKSQSPSGNELNDAQEINQENNDFQDLTDTLNSRSPVILSDLLNKIGLNNPQSINSFSYSQNESTKICWIERVFAQFDSNGNLNHTWVEYEVVFETPSEKNGDESEVNFVGERALINVLDPYTNITQERPFKMYWENQDITIWVNETRRCGKANHLDKTYREELDGSSKYLSIRLTNMIREDLVAQYSPEILKKAAINNKNEDIIGMTVNNKAVKDKINRDFSNKANRGHPRGTQYKKAHPKVNENLDSNSDAYSESEEALDNDLKNQDVQNIPENQSGYDTNENPIPRESSYGPDANKPVVKMMPAKSTKIIRNNQNTPHAAHTEYTDDFRQTESLNSDDTIEDLDFPEQKNSKEITSTEAGVNTETLQSEKAECPPSFTNILINSKFLPHFCHVQVKNGDNINVKGSFIATKRVVEQINGENVEYDEPIFELTEDTRIKVFDTRLKY